MNPHIQQVNQNPAVQSQPLTATDIASAVAQAVAQNMPQPQQQQQQLSPEQMAEMLGTYNPNEQLVDMLFGDNATPQTRMQALTQLVEGVRTNATRMAHVQAYGLMNDFAGQIREPLSMAQHLAQKQFFQDMFDGHPGLQQFEPIIKSTLSSIEGREDYPQEYGKRAEYARKHYIEMIKAQQPGFDPTKPATQHPHNPLPHQAAFNPAPYTQQAQHQPSPSLPSFGGGGQGPATPQTPVSGSAERPWATVLGNGQAAPF